MKKYSVKISFENSTSINSYSVDTNYDLQDDNYYDPGYFDLEESKEIAQELLADHKGSIGSVYIMCDEDENEPYIVENYKINGI